MNAMLLPAHRRTTFRSVLIGIAWFAIAVIFLGYIGWQSRLIIIGPVITITEPLPATTTEQILTLAGNATNIVSLHLNGRAIVTTPEGDFRERIILQNGYTIHTLEAADRYGRTTTVTQPIVRLATTSTTTNQ